MRISLTNFLILFLLIHPASSFSQQLKITVAVAANMQYAFNELKGEFEKTNHIKVDAVIGASGNLTRQIIQGAPFDVFISADTKYPESIYSKGFSTEKPKVYARGALVLWTTKQGVGLKPDLRFLLSDAIKSIAIANPKIAPYGTAAVALLKKYFLFDKLKNRLVFGESISQTSQFIATGNADIGFTAKAVVLSDQMKSKGRWIELSSEDYPPIFQSAVLLKYGTKNHSSAATKFYEFLFSQKAKDIYKKYGYLN
jgi:molybdate transport system substrate-binding protein